MEKQLSLAEPVGFLFLHTILKWVIMALHMFSPRSKPFLIGSCVQLCDEQPPVKNSTRTQQRDDLDQLGREDMERVMEVIGLCTCGHEGEQLKECNPDELSTLFEDKEPSLEEVKETFRVFDQNGDGFIDPLELQRVLTRLGFMEGSEELDACRRMIESYDENNDGKIDFVEFVKFMEISFC